MVPAGPTPAPSEQKIDRAVRRVKLSVRPIRSFEADYCLFRIHIVQDLYRKNAAECRARAALARSLEDEKAWLELADEWLRLALEFERRQSGKS